MQYWRLSAFYLFYFAALGALWPYWGLYLKSVGFDEGEIAELIAIIMATKVVAPYVWGWIADHSGRRMVIVRLASLLAALCFAGIYVSHTFWWMALVLVVYSFFWNAALPQFEATTMTHLGQDTHRYSAIRLWGSVGFIVAVTALGPVLEAWGMGRLPIIYLLLLGGIWVMSMLVREPAAVMSRGDSSSISSVLRRPAVIALFVVCFLLQASHGPYYAFYSIYLEEHGYSYGEIGWLWALGVIAEIGVFLVMHRLLPRFGTRQLMLWTLALTALRWLLIAWFVESVSVVVFAQLLHAASFGVYHAVAITLIHRYFAGKHQGRGQALYSSISFGAGGAVGSYLSGLVWIEQGPEFTFSLAAVASLLGLLVAWRGLREEPGDRSKQALKKAPGH